MTSSSAVSPDTCKCGHYRGSHVTPYGPCTEPDGIEAITGRCRCGEYEPSQTYNFRTVRVCTRCGEEKPYDGQWVETIARKGSKVQWSSLECWGCFLEKS